MAIQKNDHKIDIIKKRISLIIRTLSTLVLVLEEDQKPNNPYFPSESSLNSIINPYGRTLK